MTAPEPSWSPRELNKLNKFLAHIQAIRPTGPLTITDSRWGSAYHEHATNILEIPDIEESRRFREGVLRALSNLYMQRSSIDEVDLSIIIDELALLIPKFDIIVKEYDREVSEMAALALKTFRLTSEYSSDEAGKTSNLEGSCKDSVDEPATATDAESKGGTEEQDEENPSEAAERHPSGDETFSNRRTSRPRISDGSTKPPLKKTRIASPSDPEIHAGTSQDIIRKFTDTDRCTACIKDNLRECVVYNSDSRTTSCMTCVKSNQRCSIAKPKPIPTLKKRASKQATSSDKTTVKPHIGAPLRSGSVKPQPVARETSTDRSSMPPPPLPNIAPNYSRSTPQSSTPASPASSTTNNLPLPAAAGIGSSSSGNASIPTSTSLTQYQIAPPQLSPAVSMSPVSSQYSSWAVERALNESHAQQLQQRLLFATQEMERARLDMSNAMEVFQSSERRVIAVQQALDKLTTQPSRTEDTSSRPQ